MAKITLRDYNREIEQLVEKGLTEEAIAHCKYILKSFPKHIDTYRLLGKTYLESQRYTEATDILKRVLSVVPDDFISQIGMSLIREDEGDLDGAIWHMERAFEVQPSNPAVQDELRRLYGRRDGVQPPKIRLTRGALVRMYARGELYQQAIAEIRAALSETPKRPDLECILARMYYLAGRKAECIETCSRLIAQLPYCYEANRILAEILPGTPQVDAAEGYRQRVIALDPYALHVGPNAQTPADVADSAVTLVRFAYQPSQEDEQLPNWTNAVGVQWEDEPKAEIPDWLSAVQQRSTQDQNITDETKPDEGLVPPGSFQPDASPAQAIPDWMSSIGWSPSSGPETPPEPMSFDEENFSSEIAPAEVPDWLRNMAPINDEPEEPSNPEDLKRLNELLPAMPTEARSFESNLPASEPLPDWLQSMGEAAPEAVAETPVDALEPAAEGILPDWLQSMGEAAPEAVAETPVDSLEPAVEETLPDWLQSMGEAAQEAVAETPVDSLEPAVEETLPDWLQSMGEAAPEAAAETPVDSLEPAAEGTLPDWLQGVGEAAPEAAAETPVDALEPAAEETLPDWLQGMGEAAPEAVAETPVDSLEPAAEGILPDWLTSAGSVENVDTNIELGLSPALNEMPMSVIEEEITKPTPAYRAETPVADLQPSSPSVESELPDWLQGIGEEEPAPTDVAVEAAAELPAYESAIETPDDLQTSVESVLPIADQTILGEMAPEILEETAVEPIAEAADFGEPSLQAQLESSALENLEAAMPEQELQETPASEVTDLAPAEAVSADDMDAALAWLESLAIKQGADEETMLVPKDQRMDAPPDWVTKTDEPRATEVEQSSEIPLETESPIAEVEEPVAQQDVYAAAAVEELSAYITPVPTEDQPDWFQPETHLVSEIESIEVETAPIEDVPHAISPTDEDQPVAEQDMDSALAWLESLAVKQGVDEDTLLVPKDQRMDAPPEWVTKTDEPRATEVEQSSEIPLETESPIAEVEEPVAQQDVYAAAVVEEPSAEFTPVPTEDQPDWFQPETHLASEIESIEAETAPIEDVPHAISPTVEDQPVAEQDMDSALAWLESLAVKQGADEETMLVPKDQRLDAPPEWVFEETHETPDEVRLEAPIPTAEAEPDATDLPAWLQNVTEEDFASPETMDAASEQAAAADELPDWLQGIGEEMAVEPEFDLSTHLASESLTAIEEPQSMVESATVEQEPQVFAHTPDAELLSVQDTVVESSQAGQDPLERGQQAIRKGRMDEAVAEYSDLINRSERLEEVIHDLREALYRYPVDISLWQSLGDAYARNNQLQEALDAYTKAEELLR